MLKSSPNLPGFPSLPVAVWVAATHGIWIIDFTVGPPESAISVSHFHQPAGEYVLAASNWVRLRVSDTGICKDLCCTKSPIHSYEAFLLQGSSEDSLFILLLEKACVNRFFSRWHRWRSYQLLHILQLFIPRSVQSSLCFRDDKPETWYLWTLGSRRSHSAGIAK